MTPFNAVTGTDKSRDRKQTNGWLQVVAVGVVKETGSDCLWIWVSFGVGGGPNKNDPKLTVVMVTQFCEYRKPPKLYNLNE